MRFGLVDEVPSIQQLRADDDEILNGLLISGISIDSNNDDLSVAMRTISAQQSLADIKDRLNDHLVQFRSSSSPIKPTSPYGRASEHVNKQAHLAEVERKRIIEETLQKSLDRLHSVQRSLSRQSEQEFTADLKQHSDKQSRVLKELAGRYKLEVTRETDRVQSTLRSRQSEQRQILKETLQEVYDRQMKLEKEEKERIRLKKEHEERERNRQDELKREHEKKQQLLEAERQQKAQQLEKERLLKQSELEQQEKTKQEQERLASALSEVETGNQTRIDNAQVLIDKLKHIKNTIDAQIKQTRSMFNEALRYRMQFTTKVGAITNSQRHILQFTQELKQILDRGRSIDTQLLYPWLLNNLAKQIVKQSESEVAANLKKCVPLAALTMHLFPHHPDLRDYLYGRMYKKCRYAIPAYPRFTADQSNDQNAIKKQMGYKKTGSDKFETTFDYRERMKGIIALQAALMLPLQQSQPEPNAVNIWQFVAEYLNMKPRAISALLLETLLKICGRMMQRRYPRQFPKLLHYIKTEYMQRCQGVIDQGDQVRLELIVTLLEQQSTAKDDELLVSSELKP